MFRNYLMTACKVFMRRKLFTFINLLCIVLTLVVLMVVTALLEATFFPGGAEARSGRYLQIVVVHSSSPNGNAMRTAPLGYKLIEQYLKPMKSIELLAASTMPRPVSVYQDGRVSELQMRRTDAAYWKILDFTLLQGRLPMLEDEEKGRNVAVINDTSARKLFGDTSAVGKTISVGGQTLQVIGVVADEDELHTNAFSEIWAPITTLPSSDYRQQLSGDFMVLLLARSKADLRHVRDEVKMIAATVEFEDAKLWSKAVFWADSKIEAFARQTIGDARQEDSGAGLLIAIIVAMMLLFMLLPALNLVNLNTGRILERSSEIGVRKAFGATNGQLVTQLVIENVILCLIGGVIGLLCTEVALMWLESLELIPYLDVSVNYAVMAWGLLITLVFGLLSGVLPAWKMSRLDPVHALKGAI